MSPTPPPDKPDDKAPPMGTGGSPVRRSDPALFQKLTNKQLDSSLPEALAPFINEVKRDGIARLTGSPSSSSQVPLPPTRPTPAPAPASGSAVRPLFPSSGTQALPPPPPPPSKYVDDSWRSPHDTNQHSRDERMACSFPGMLKILVPEKSFLPVPLAVRVANLSPGGAMVEVHDRTKLDQDLALPNRFFELKVAHPEIPMLRGTVAWSDLSRSNPILGLAAFERNAELAEIAGSISDSQIKHTGPPPLPPPVLDGFPPVVNEETVIITGMAQEAMEVVVKRDDRKFTCKVVRERFTITLELEPDEENHFSLRSIAGERKSRPIPIRIQCEKLSTTGGFRFNSSMMQDKSGDHCIKVDFAGTVRQAERVLYRFSQLMAMSERVSVEAQLMSPGGFDKRLFDALRSEGSLLSSDTSRNEAASKLLDELL